MAVSHDGFLATGRDDNMRWTGPTDKALFKLLTLSNMQPILAGWRTAQMMPPLTGRVVHPLSTGGLTLAKAVQQHPNAWLIGGPTIALEALRSGMISQAIFCRCPAMLGDGLHSNVLMEYLNELPTHTLHIAEIDVLIYHPRFGGA